MKITFIAAMSENRVIGVQGKLPWHLPHDMRRFKELTIGKTILMGRKTFDSIKKALPHRNNLVLTNDRSFSADHTRVFHCKEDVLASPYEEILVIGGGEIYQLFLPECQKIHLTLVHTTLAGDALFPSFRNFEEKHRSTNAQDERHAYPYSFIEYERRAPQ